MKVQAAFVKENTTQVKVDDLDKYENPKVSVYYTTGSGHGKKTTYVVTFDAGSFDVVSLLAGLLPVEQAANDKPLITIAETHNNVFVFFMEKFPPSLFN